MKIKCVVIVNNTMDSQRFFRKTDDPVMCLFFSDNNMNVIHEASIDIIKRSTGVTISRQSERDLLGIMQFVFSVYANTTCMPSVVDEVRRLNKLVLDESVPIIKSGMLMYLQYIKDASTLPVPIDRSVSTTEDKSLGFGSFM